LFSILLSGKMIIFAANLNTMNRNYRINLRREPEGGYTVFVPSLPGCITYGETVDEAIDMAKEAIGLYIEELEDRGEPVPDDSNMLEYSLNLAMA
jgi:predicted RNase H-like HicB family nuclease